MYVRQFTVASPAHLHDLLGVRVSSSGPLMHDDRHLASFARRRVKIIGGAVMGEPARDETPVRPRRPHPPGADPQPAENIPAQRPSVFLSLIA
jgi:hypothetical protein